MCGLVNRYRGGFAMASEFMALGMLLIEGIHCFKAYTNFAGYDLVAVNPASGKTARIQVKSRWATDFDKSFPIKNFNCDFVVLAALNRGYRLGRSGAWPPIPPMGGKHRNFIASLSMLCGRRRMSATSGERCQSTRSKTCPRMKDLGHSSATS